MRLLALLLLPGRLLAARSASTGRQSEALWSWGKLRVSGWSPAPRQGHAAVEVGRRVYILGGCSQDTRCYNDVHIFDTEHLTWNQEALTGDVPEPRSGHSASLLRAEVYVIGGASSRDTFGDVHCLDLVRRHWTRVPVTTGTGRGPGRRTNHAAAVDGSGRIYVFGGYTAEGKVLNDLWVLRVSRSPTPSLSPAPSPSSGTTSLGLLQGRWAEQLPSGGLPAARAGHSLTLVDRRLVLFGGYASCGTVLNDLYVYDLDTQRWSALDIAGAAPWPRQAHSAVRHGRDVIIAGGCDVSDAHSRCFEDVWSLSLVDMEWTQRTPRRAASWPAREGHSATFVRGDMFVFGGCQLGTQCYNDMTVVDSFDACPAACGGRGQCINQEFCRCTAPGYTGHDCMQPLTCAQDCGAHGSCGQNGHCICDNGWTGPNCAVNVPCPGTPKCSNRGFCLPTGSCHCFPGFGGADCTITNHSCPSACSGHGHCHPNGQCACQQGWSGPACNQRISLLQLKCPKDCCGHGSCVNGGCRCRRGWYGGSCNLNETLWSAASLRFRARLLEEASQRRHQAKVAGSLLQVRQLLTQAEVYERKAAGWPRPEAEDLALIEHAIGSENCAKPEPTVTASDFGVGDAGTADSEGPETCEDNCNYRGLCEAGMCYCQPGHYGETCQRTRTKDKHTLSLLVVMVVSLSCSVISFTVLLTFLCLRRRSEMMGEVQMGFNSRGAA